jgi:hypothetical protein
MAFMHQNLFLRVVIRDYGIPRYVRTRRKVKGGSVNALRTLRQMMTELTPHPASPVPAAPLANSKAVTTYLTISFLFRG